ncbi:MAG: hypothetical protein ABSE17_03940 [Candidatus Levyibacteriota bacterium]|jgi:hypothetical protein
MANEGGVDLASIGKEENPTKVPEPSDRRAIVETFLRTSSQSPLFPALAEAMHQETTPGGARALTGEEIQALKVNLVDAGLLPEVTREVGIVAEDVARLQSMTPQERQQAIDIGLKNLTVQTLEIGAFGKPIGVAEQVMKPGGVRFGAYEVNNRTGERKPVAAPVVLQHPIAPPVAPKL